jgi:hypothetical protein
MIKADITSLFVIKLKRQGFTTEIKHGGKTCPQISQIDADLNK